MLRDLRQDPIRDLGCADIGSVDEESDYLNRSISGGITTSRTTDGSDSALSPIPGGVNSTPRTRTTGWRVALPEASSAAEQIWSAMATIVECITRPSASGMPR